ncbi:hypothetical protein [Actinacidiphila glaucinigra]|uniref:hypothetical protein n=1 Tax=Actinacidiphila glaucinigra TaxID=235986 RepID=UPI00366E83D4
MARQITQLALCDWHQALPQPQQAEATQIRTNPQGKENDLCDPCAMVYDFFMPRAEEVLTFLDPTVLEAFFRAGHTPVQDKPDRVPVQIAIPVTAAADDKAPPDTATAKAARPSAKAPKASKAAKNGRWLPGVDQVRCPLTHRAGSPQDYWVKLRDRGSHAKSSHKLLGPQIAYELPDPDQVGDEAYDLTIKCFDHKVCAEAGGYGFKDKHGLHCHRIKATTWERAHHGDAAETLEPSEATAA